MLLAGVEALLLYKFIVLIMVMNHLKYFYRIKSDSS